MVPDMNTLGVPVRYDPQAKMISDSRGLWRWKKIVVGPMFWINFDEREKQAILLHEAGHCKMFHLEKRILRLPLMLVRPSFVASYCRAQEFAADQFAAGCGYAQDLARALSKIRAGGGPLHPDLPTRIARLLAWRSKE